MEWVETLRAQIKGAFGKGWTIYEFNGRARLRYRKSTPEKDFSDSAHLPLAWCEENRGHIFALCSYLFASWKRGVRMRDALDHWRRQPESIRIILNTVNKPKAKVNLRKVKATINMAKRWASMLERCYMQDSPSYEYYGARGIKVCEEWHDFATFVAFWKEAPHPYASMGRIDNDGDYAPENCRWENQGQQNNNTRRSKRITWNGRTQTLRDWAREYDVGARRLSERLRRGWDFQRAVTTPCPKGFDQEAKERKEETDRLWAINGQLYQARSRFRRGIPLGLPAQDLLAVEGL